MHFSENWVSIAEGLAKRGHLKIAVLRVLKLGDMLCAVPALRAIRGAFPDAEIHLIGLPSMQPLMQRFSRYIDRFLAFPGFPGFPEQPPQLMDTLEFFRNAQKTCYDLALNLHGDGHPSSIVTELLGAGISAALAADPQSALYQGSILFKTPPDTHEVDRQLHLCEQLGIMPLGRHLELPISQVDLLTTMHQLAGMVDFGKPFVCLHPGAFHSSRRWPPECFAALGNVILNHGYKIVITGQSHENFLARRVIQEMNLPSTCGKDVVNTTPLNLDIGALASLFKLASFVVTNDTGPAHIASALGVPSIVIFQLEELIKRWGPFNRQRHIVVKGSTFHALDDAVRAVVRLIASLPSAGAAGSRLFTETRTAHG